MELGNSLKNRKLKQFIIISMPELSMVYVPIIIPLALTLGFVTAAAIVLVGLVAGFIAVLTNPFTMGIEQKIAGLPLYSATGYRITTLIVMYTVGMFFVLRYAKKIQKNPELSTVYLALSLQFFDLFC